MNQIKRDLKFIGLEDFQTTFIRCFWNAVCYRIRIEGSPFFFHLSYTFFVLLLIHFLIKHSLSLHTRYSAQALLGHRFFKQIKRSSNLLSLLPNKSSLLDRLSEPDSSKPDVCTSRCLNCEHCKHSGFIDYHYIQQLPSSNDGDKLPVKWLF